MLESIPIIDIGPLVRRMRDFGLSEEEPEVKDVLQQLDRACRDIGFFYVKGHGVSPELSQAVLDAGHEFFSLPESQKLLIGMNETSAFRGYQKLGVNITKGRPDLHEAIDGQHVTALSRDADILILLFQGVRFSKSFIDSEKSSNWSESVFLESGGNLPLPCTMKLTAQYIVSYGHEALGFVFLDRPDYPHTFRPILEEYLDVMTDLARILMRGIALALGGPRDTFEGKRAGDPFWILRVIGYPPIYDVNYLSEANNEDMGCGEHTDYGLLTFVNQDPYIPSLQVKSHEGKWIWADPIPGTFVVNIGDMLKIWTNGLYQSTLHRVINNHSKYRVSVPFFYEPNFDAQVEPLEFLEDRTKAETPKLAPVVYGHHVINKIQNNFG